MGFIKDEILRLYYMLQFFYDLPNLFFILVFILFYSVSKKIPSWIALVLSLSTFSPYIFNDFLFPANYMPDQFKYFEVVNNIRYGNFDYNPFARTVEIASWFLALIPLPLVETIKSLGFFNRFIVVVLIIWLYREKNTRGLPLFLLLFYPSLLLYSSLSLRDTIVFLFMVLPVIFVIDGKILKAIFFSLPLLFLKFQNFFLILIFIVFYILRNRESNFYKFRHFLYVIVFLVFIPFIQNIIFLLDFYRRAMYQEDGGDPTLYTNIGDIYGFILFGVQSAPYFLMKPLPWEAGSLLQMIQSIENILILFFMFLLFFKAFRIDKNTALTWFFYFFIALTVYGLVVFNYGTSARYKFPFIVLVTVGLAYDIYKKHNVVLRWRK